MQLKTAEVDRYGPLYDCRPPCQEGISVISGPNEAGKTLYLEAILQLLEPAVVDMMEPDPRVSQPPTGRVVIEHAGEQFTCNGKTSLRDITGIEPDHLQSIFVVRDSDLKLPNETAYYTSLVDTLGEVHTTEIEAIEASLKDRGRLTKKNLNISNDQSAEKAKEVRDKAAILADKIQEYVARIEEENLDELDSRRLRLRTRLQHTRDELEIQQQARSLAEYQRLSDQLETFQSATESIVTLEAFDRETLDELKTLEQDRQRDKRDLEQLESDIESKTSQITTTTETLSELKSTQSTLKRREPAVEKARTALTTFRDNQDNASGAGRQLALTKPVVLIALLGTIVSGVSGAITGVLPVVGLGIALLVIAVGSGILFHRANARRSALERSRISSLEEARDAGFEVESVDNIAPAIESYDSKIADINTQVTRKKQERSGAKNALNELEQRYAELESNSDKTQQQITKYLENASVKSIDEFESRVKKREQLEEKRNRANQRLIERFSEPTVDSSKEKARVWKNSIEDIVQERSENEIPAERYDEVEHERLEEDVTSLEHELDALDDQLDQHDTQLDEFDSRARSLHTQPFIDQSIGLEARTTEGLHNLMNTLHRVVEQIEEDAEISRKALQLFSEIKSDEEQKLTELFDPDGPASRTFEDITGGAYTEVAYDPENHELTVQHRDGQQLEPSVLSQGTRDQLYFATRVSLATQLLGNRPGFFLLDDPFLTADPERLRQGFRTLEALANTGWQILYLTAKEEISDKMVNEFDLHHIEMGQLHS